MVAVGLGPGVFVSVTVGEGVIVTVGVGVLVGVAVTLEGCRVAVGGSVAVLVGMLTAATNVGETGRSFSGSVSGLAITETKAITAQAIPSQTSTVRTFQTRSCRLAGLREMCSARRFGRTVRCCVVWGVFSSMAAILL